MDRLQRLRDSWPGLVLLALLVQLPHMLNPGYFSHDELQWGFRATSVPFADILWIDPFDFATFQYRPLTFNLWLLLSAAFFDTPWLMHGMQALFGAGVFLLVDRLMRRHGIAGWTRWCAGLLWLGFPYVTYVHGWVGTFGDQIWLAAGIGVLLACFRRAPDDPSRLAPLLAGFAGTWIGLLGKESALVIPAFALAHALLCPRHRRIFLWATLGASLAAASYLGLRLEVILEGAAQTGAYAPAWTQPPLRIAEYWTFPATLQRLDSFATFAEPSSRVCWSITTLGVLFATLAWYRWRHAALLAVLPTIALGPTLVLPNAANQYAYGFATALVIVLAHAARQLPRAALLAGLPWICLVLLHGVHVVDRQREVGALQSVLLPEINRLLQSDGTLVLYVRAEHPDDTWRLQRTVTTVPGYREVAWGGRVTALAHDDTSGRATHVMARDGRLSPLSRDDGKPRS